MIKNNIHAATLRFRKKVLSGYRIDVVFLVCYTIFRSIEKMNGDREETSYEKSSLN
jgi:hypothetical protein